MANKSTAEELTARAALIRRMIVDETVTEIGLNRHEAMDLEEGTKWTGVIRIYRGMPHFEFELPGSFDGRIYAALDHGILSNALAADVEGK